MAGEWVLFAGALCLSSHYDVCINHSGDKDSPYVVSSPLKNSPPVAYLGDAKFIGESIGKELEEFPMAGQSSVQGPLSWPSVEIPVAGAGSLSPRDNMAWKAVKEGTATMKDGMTTRFVDGSCIMDGVVFDQCSSGVTLSTRPETPPPKMTVPAFPISPSVISAPYGMSKDEFGVFIEKHTGRGKVTCGEYRPTTLTLVTMECVPGSTVISVDR